MERGNICCTARMGDGYKTRTEVGGIVNMMWTSLSVWDHNMRGIGTSYIYEEIDQVITITHILSNEHPRGTIEKFDVDEEREGLSATTSTPATPPLSSPFAQPHDLPVDYLPYHTFPNTFYFLFLSIVSISKSTPSYSPPSQPSMSPQQ